MTVARCLFAISISFCVANIGSAELPNILLILAGLILALFVGWEIGPKRFAVFTNVGAKGRQVPPYWGVLFKYLIPAFILVVFLMQFI